MVVILQDVWINWIHLRKGITVEVAAVLAEIVVAAVATSAACITTKTFRKLSTIEITKILPLLFYKLQWGFRGGSGFVELYGSSVERFQRLSSQNFVYVIVKGHFNHNKLNLIKREERVYRL